MSDHNFLIDRLEKWQADPSNGINENGRTRRLLKEAASALRSGAPAAFQPRVDPWLMECFGLEIARDILERNHRFLEEALELVQANGCTSHEAHQLVDYVYGRDQGEINQEVGGVMVTLAALCLASGVDMHEAAETELARVWTKVEKIRSKHFAKPKFSPLPGPSDAVPTRTAASSAEPVAWRYRFITSTDGKEWSDWFIVDDLASVPHRTQEEIQPLYATPPSVGNADAVTDADWLKAWTKRTGHTMKPGPKRDAMLADARWAASVLAALSASVEGWREISTAPKDGSYVLVSNGIYTDVARWSHGSFGGFAKPDDATHWMPLPVASVTRNDRLPPQPITDGGVK